MRRYFRPDHGEPQCSKEALDMYKDPAKRDMFACFMQCIYDMTPKQIDIYIYYISLSPAMYNLAIMEVGIYYCLYATLIFLVQCMYHMSNLWVPFALRRETSRDVLEMREFREA